MKRETALKKLKECIPSFNLEYIHWGKKVDKNRDMSWLYKDEIYSQYDGERKNFYLPVSIPTDFLVGIEAEVNGTKYVSRNDPHRDGKRKVGLEVQDFAYYGNTHKYGKLRISGPHWSDGNGYTSRRELTNVDPRVTSIWDVDVCRIITAQDLGMPREDWNGYDAGESTSRFSSLDELYCTAAYVALLRVEGDFDMSIGSFATTPGTKDFLVKVIDGDVGLTPKLKQAMKRMTVEK